MALLLRMLGSQTEAEELLQEVFLELWRRARRYDADRASVSTWVVTVSRSRALDALRARQRRGGGIAPAGGGDRARSAGRVSARSLDPFEQAQQGGASGALAAE